MANDTEFALSVLSSDNLPEPIEDVAHFVLIAPEILKAQKAEIQACEKMNVAKDIVDAKREDLNRANELLIEAKVRLGEFSRKLNREQGNKKSDNLGTGAQNKLREIGIDPRSARRYEKMTSTAFEIEKDKARKENRPPEQRNVISIAETLKKRRNEDYANSYKVYRDMEEAEKTELQKKLEEVEKRKKMSDAVDIPIRKVWAMPLDREHIDCYIEYALCVDNKSLSHHFQIIDESIERLIGFKELLKDEMTQRGNILRVIKCE